MSERLTWKPGKYGGEVGYAGRLRLFSVHFGVTRQDDMWALGTELPLRHSSLGQHYPTPTHAKVAAERLFAAFLAETNRTAQTTDPNGESR